MSEFGTQLREHYEQISAPLDTERLTEQFIGADRYRQRRRPAVAMAAAAVLTLLVIGAVGIMVLNGNGGPDVIEIPQPNPPTTLLPAPESWNPILATTYAKPAPGAATCPASTDPNVAGLIGQQRPHPGWVGNLAAAFDQRAGRIVHVDQTGETWTFDVCANRWHRMNPTGSPADQEDLFDLAGQPSGVLGPLVYDVDSDVTVALNFGYVAVYDANNNTWSRRGGDESIHGFGGAVYDRESGLILTTRMVGDSAGETGMWELSAYDVDTDTWSSIGIIPGTIGQLDFLGYSEGIDRFIIVGFVHLEPVTVLVDPRTGETTLITTETPIVDLAWPGAVYGPADDTVYVSHHFPPDGRFTACGFNTTTLTWTCAKAPETVPSTYRLFAAAAGDPINNRLVLINGVYGDRLSAVSDDVWAIDLETGDWTQLLGPSDQ